MSNKLFIFILHPSAFILRLESVSHAASVEGIVFDIQIL